MTATAKTDDNGEKIDVAGIQAAGYFRITTNQKPAELPECVWTFAYWHPAMIEQKRRNRLSPSLCGDAKQRLDMAAERFIILMKHFPFAIIDGVPERL